MRATSNLKKKVALILGMIPSLFSGQVAAVPEKTVRRHKRVPKKMVEVSTPDGPSSIDLLRFSRGVVYRMECEDRRLRRKKTGMGCEPGAIWNKETAVYEIPLDDTNLGYLAFIV